MFTKIDISLQGPTYTPFDSGIYTVTPGLLPLPKANFGNSKIDQHLFQIDNCYQTFIHHKTTLAQTNPQHHILSHHLNPTLAATIENFIKQTFLKEHKLNLEQIKHHTPLPYKNSTELDILCQYIQEDLAIIEQLPQTQSITPPAPSNSIRYLHISSPNYWAPEEKIGKTFKEIHAPVAGMNLDVENNILTAITTKGPFVRFAWGITTDTQLNHHPIPPLNIPPELWHGRIFNKQQPQAYLRIERQVTIPFPEHHAALFLIHPYFTNIATLSTDHKTKLLHAINSMTPEQKKYKGLTDAEELIEWIKESIE